MRSEADKELYDDAIFFYGRGDLDRPELMRQLLALGVEAEAIRWAVDNPGCGCSFI